MANEISKLITPDGVSHDISDTQSRSDLSNKVNRSGDTMTGALLAPALTASATGSPTITSQSTDVDASKANNNVSSDHYPAWMASDKYSRILTRMECVASSNGNIAAYWYVRNYNTSGSQVGQKGIKISMAKDGTMTYTVDDNSKFRTAIDALCKSGDTATGKITFNQGIAIKAGSGSNRPPYFIALLQSYGDGGSVGYTSQSDMQYAIGVTGESNHAASTGAALSSDTGMLGLHWYSQTGKIANQPAQYGFLLTCATGKGYDEQHSIFMEQANGSLYHMGTNRSSSESPPAYKKIWDSGNAPYGSVSFTRSHSSVSYQEGLVCNRFGNVVTFAGYFSCGATIAVNTTLYSGLPKPAGGKHIYFTWSGYDFFLNATDGSIRTNGQIVSRTYVGTFTYVCA